MNAVVLQGIGETLEGLSTLIQSQLQPKGMPENERQPLMQAGEQILRAKVQLSVALAAYLDNELNQSGD